MSGHYRYGLFTPAGRAAWCDLIAGIVARAEQEAS